MARITAGENVAESDNERDLKRTLEEVKAFEKPALKFQKSLAAHIRERHTGYVKISVKLLHGRIVSVQQMDDITEAVSLDSVGGS